ncbi:MAG: polysaccharide deacetylase family protein [Eubacteriales bacterium]
MKFTKHMAAFLLASLVLAFPLLTFLPERTAAASPAGFLDWFGKGEETDETDPISEDVPPKRGKNSPRRKTEEKDCAASAGVMNWYCKHMEDGKRPPMPSEMNFIGKHGGYFLGEDEKVLYLTFDAGYENGNIARILDTLKEEEVPAAFFVLENLVTRDTALVQRMIDEGHIVCNHTARHADMSAKSESEFTDELAAMERIYKETLGCEIAKYYRPPEGKFTEANLEWANSLGYKTIFWSYAYADWDNENQMSADKALTKVLSGTHNGEVLLLHPTSATNAEILPALIREWKKLGYRFGTLDELTGNCDLTKTQT